MSWQYPQISELQKTTISVTNNTVTPQVFNLQGNMTGMPFIESSERVFTAENVMNGASYNAFGVYVNGKIYTASQFGANVKVLDVATNTVLYTIVTGNNPFSVIQANGFVYVSGGPSSGAGFVHIINPNTDTIISTIVTDGTGVMTLCGDNIIVSNSSGSTFDVSVIDTLTNTLTGTVVCANQTYFGSWNATTDTVYLFNNNSSGDGFTVIDIGALTSSYVTTSYPTGTNGSLVYIPATDQILVAQGGYGTSLYLHNAVTFAEVTNINLTPYYTQGLLLVDGYVYVSTAFDTKLYKYSVADEIIEATLPITMATNDVPLLGYDPYNNTVLYPLADGTNAKVAVVDIDSFTVESTFPVGINPYSFIVVDEETFYTVNYTSSFTAGLSFVGYRGAVTFTTDSGESIDAWSQQLSYQPMCIDHMIVDNGDSRASLSYGITYGSSNPSDDGSTNKISLLKYISAEQLANLVEFQGSDLPQRLLDGFHYLQGTVAGGETLIFSFWYRNLNALDTLKNDYHPAMSKYATMMYGKAIAEKLKTSPEQLYEKRKEQLILSKVSERDEIILVIRRKAK